VVKAEPPALPAGAVVRTACVDVVVLGDHAAASGTVGRERGFENFVEGFGSRRHSMHMLAVLVARFASWLFRCGREFSFGEGSSLSFAAAFSEVETLFEIGDPLEEFVDLAIPLTATRADRLIHKYKVGNPGVSSCTEKYLTGGNEIQWAYLLKGYERGRYAIGKDLMQAAGTVTKKLAKWLAEKGYVEDTEDAQEQAGEAAKDLPNAQTVLDILNAAALLMGVAAKPTENSI
jgi:hypothetical protein